MRQTEARAAFRVAAARARRRAAAGATTPHPDQVKRASHCAMRSAGRSAPTCTSPRGEPAATPSFSTSRTRPPPSSCATSIGALEPAPEWPGGPAETWFETA